MAAWWLRNSVLSLVHLRELSCVFVTAYALDAARGLMRLSKGGMHSMRGAEPGATVGDRPELCGAGPRRLARVDLVQGDAEDAALHQ